VLATFIDGFAARVGMKLMKRTKRNLLAVVGRSASPSTSALLAPLLALTACVLPDRDLGSLVDTDAGTGTSGESDASASGNGTGTDSAGDTADDGGFPTECVPPEVDPPSCAEDADGDTVRYGCDNAPDYFNPDQRDMDEDGIGDVADLCPTIESAPTNSADSDDDGIGNECDSCRQKTTEYNEADGVSVDPRMLVRNIPSQTDTDEDGIGDVCDNCITVANCEGYGPGNEFEVGDPIAYDDRSKCQRDDDSDLVGDACVGVQAQGAAGPVGLGPDDDFDQDGLVNDIDICPRQPVDVVACTDDTACGPDRVCDTSVGICNHVDRDGDLVGDVCDTCAFISNPDQVTEGGMQEDDDDGDFVGSACETISDCAVRSDARPFSFYEVAVDGNCCTVQLVEDPDTGDLIAAVGGRQLLDPDGLPVRRTCDEANEALRTCRRLPDWIASLPGVLTLPAGCDAALASAGYTAVDNPLLSDGGVPSLDALWNRMCHLPQFDQDFDGIGDDCDLCPFDFDPENLEYIDDDGKVSPNDGRYCNGDYSLDATCGE
jgi:hypothetical protein